MAEINPMEGQKSPRPHSILSHGSKRSWRSSGSASKLELTESPKDKKKLHTKANPLRAMNEAQPADVALEESNLEHLGKRTWRDSNGEIIVDPDRSNPTRPRNQRPLDTILSFEAAIDRTWAMKTGVSYVADQGKPNTMNWNRGSLRNSYVGSNNGNGNRSSYYGGTNHLNTRGHSQRLDSVAKDSQGRDPQYSHPPRPMRYGSSPMTSLSNNENNFYPVHGHQPSYDTITTGVGSYGTDTRGNSTGPSSQNSSVDRFPVKPEGDPVANNHGIGYTSGPYSPVSPTYSGEQSFWKGAIGRPQVPYGRNEYSVQGESNDQVQSLAAPQREDPPHTPIKLNTGFDASIRATPPKRQGWLKRRFSRKV